MPAHASAIAPPPSRSSRVRGPGWHGGPLSLSKQRRGVASRRRAVDQLRANGAHAGGDMTDGPLSCRCRAGDRDLPRLDRLVCRRPGGLGGPLAGRAGPAGSGQSVVVLRHDAQHGAQGVAAAVAEARAQLLARPSPERVGPADLGLAGDVAQRVPQDEPALVVQGGRAFRLLLRCCDDGTARRPTPRRRAETRRRWFASRAIGRATGTSLARHEGAPVEYRG